MKTQLPEDFWSMRFKRQKETDQLNRSLGHIKPGSPPKFVEFKSSGLQQPISDSHTIENNQPPTKAVGEICDCTDNG